MVIGHGTSSFDFSDRETVIAIGGDDRVTASGRASSISSTPTTFLSERIP